MGRSDPDALLVLLVNRISQSRAPEAGPKLTGLRQSTTTKCNALVMTYSYIKRPIRSSPAIATTDIPTEAEPFARIASGILINVGTPYQEQPSGMLKPAGSAHEVRTPWVVDPVAVGTLPLRTALASRLLNQFPTAIHGDASEVMALVGLGATAAGLIPQTPLRAPWARPRTWRTALAKAQLAAGR